MNGKFVVFALALVCLAGVAQAGILIRQGDDGVAVKGLQHLMNHYGAGLVVDGDFGPGTKRSVQSIQTQIGVTADGIVGPVTLGAMYVDIREGTVSNAAKAAQVLLGTTDDGFFYSGSINVLRSFQASVPSISNTNVVDDATWNALFAQATGNNVVTNNGGTVTGGNPTTGGGGMNSNGQPTSVSSQCLDIVRSFEGLHLNAYLDSVGVPTIGYGHTKGVRLGQSITEQQAINFLSDDLADAQSSVHSRVSVPLSQQQFDALVSFVFNVGGGGLKNTGVARALAARNYSYVPNELSRWVYGDGVVLPGLVRRRCSEGKLFSQGVVDTNPSFCPSYP